MSGAVIRPRGKSFYGPDSPLTYAGLRVILSHEMVRDTVELNFPPSRHRSRRIHKKLLKRHGYRREPRMDAFVSRAAGFMVMHPLAWEQLRLLAARRASLRPTVLNAWGTGMTSAHDPSVN